MTERRPNHRLIKTLRTYTVEEVANLLDTHKNTVRRWIKDGLPVLDDRRPVLIHGQVLSNYLRAKRAKYKQTCKPGEIFCVRCKAPKSPDLAEYKPLTATTGILAALCPGCGSTMNRRVSLAKLDQIRGAIGITFPQGCDT